MKIFSLLWYPVCCPQEKMGDLSMYIELDELALRYLDDVRQIAGKALELPGIVKATFEVEPEFTFFHNEELLIHPGLPPEMRRYIAGAEPGTEELPYQPVHEEFLELAESPAVLSPPVPKDRVPVAFTEGITLCAQGEGFWWEFYDEQAGATVRSGEIGWVWLTRAIAGLEPSPPKSRV